MTPARPFRRRWPWAVGGTLAVLVVAVGVCEVSGWPFLRGPVQDALGSAVGAPVTLGPQTRLHLLWNPRLRADRLSVEGADAAAGKLLDSSGLLVRWSWPDLWHWKRGGALHLREVSAKRLDARYLRRADGTSNWPQFAADTGVPTVGLLQIGNGRVEFADETADTDLDIAFKGHESTARTTDDDDAAYQTTVQGRYEGLPVKLSATSGAALPLLGSDTSGAPDAPMVPLKVSGNVGKAQIEFQGQALALMGSPLIDGGIELHAGSIGRVGDVLGITLPETAPFRLQAGLRHAMGVWRLRDVQLSVGASRVGGDYRYDTRVQPPLLSGQIKARRIRLQDLGPAIGVTPDAPAKPDDRVLPEREFDIPSLAAMDADLDVNVDELDFGTPLLRPAFNLRSHLVLAKSILRLEDLQAQAGGGSVSGMSQLDGRKGAADWHAELRFNKLDVAKWIAGVRKSAAATEHAQAVTKLASPGQAPLRPATAYLTGELDASVNVRGSGKSTASILASLDGEAQATLRDGTASHLLTEMLGIDIAQALGVAIRGDDALPLRCARIDLRIENGVVVPRRAVFDNRDSTVQVTGKVDLRDESLDLRATTSPKDFSLMSLRSPVIVGGTLGAPQVTVDASPLLARAAASVALGVIATPAAALIPWIDPGSKEEGDPCATLAPHNAQGAAPHSARASAARSAKAGSSP